MNKEELKDRTKKLALDVIRFSSRLPQKQDFWVISKQLIRSATSVGANYRSGCRAKSKADFIAKLAIVEEEADETLYWLELIEELGFKKDDDLKRLKDETDQLISIIVASKRTARGNL